MRLIDLDALKQNLCGDCTMNFPKECRQIGCVKVDNQDIIEALRIPIIDAVPVEFIKGEIKNNKGFYNSSLRRLLDEWAERKEE